MSLNKNVTKLERLLAGLCASPDIIALTETRLNDNSPIKNITLQKYEIINTNSKTTAGGLLVRQSINYKMRDDLRLNIEECEDIWIEIGNNHNSQIFGAVYRHPRHNYLQFQNVFKNTIDKLNKNKEKYYIAGDFNINLINYSRSNPVKYLYRHSTQH